MSSKTDYWEVSSNSKESFGVHSVSVGWQIPGTSMPRTPLTRILACVFQEKLSVHWECQVRDVRVVLEFGGMGDSGETGVKAIPGMSPTDT